MRFHNPHSLAFGDLVQGLASRRQNDWNGGKFPKPSDMKINKRNSTDALVWSMLLPLANF